MSIIRLIRMGSSGDNLESVDFSYGRRRTSRSAIGSTVERVLSTR